MRAIFEFGKFGRLRFISHLDLQRFIMRAFRRTELPVAYSHGFNPHPQLSFASALAMGWASNVELMDVRLTENVDPEWALQQMQSALPPEMPVHRCRLVDDRHDALMARLEMADYTIDISGKDKDKLLAFIPEYMNMTEVMAIRKTKSSEREINIRPLTLNLRVEGDTLCARLMLTPENTLKPELLISKLCELSGAEDIGLFITRRSLLGSNENGNVLPLFDL